MSTRTVKVYRKGVLGFNEVAPLTKKSFRNSSPSGKQGLTKLQVNFAEKRRTLMG
ncbi:MAG: hypothetical protein RMK89_12835 [Armatimonadota bacterium]|nr:hypothetical protein [Armatimonadota bacterium]MDW8144333.1 hypothetical protein [Armatimonadota bacterium]